MIRALGASALLARTERDVAFSSEENCTHSDAITVANVAHAKRKQIAGSKFAVYSEIENDKVTSSFRQL